uniref:PsbP-like protein 2, chloroplastic n=1 Tax=Anthurium amnicola TaxID=1678845 RepID=A0A1D1XYV8_9ARAE
MAAVSCWAPGLPNQLLVPRSSFATRPSVAPASVVKASLGESASVQKECIKRRLILAGVGTLATSLALPSITSAEEVPEKYNAFVDYIDGYSYYYPSDWRDFDFTGCDSAFKDRNVALQHVRVSFIPTEKSDIRDLGSMEEVIPDLVKNVYAAPTQMPTIFDVQEVSVTLSLF